MNRITVAERRARLAVRHHVAPPERVSAVSDAACDVVCLHASDPATVYVQSIPRFPTPLYRELVGWTTWLRSDGGS
ncbi:MAG: hypothetical protein WEE50_04420 [Chloroflexota bacterium]